MKVVLVSTFAKGAYGHVVKKIFHEMGHQVFIFDPRNMMALGKKPKDIGDDFVFLCDAVEPDVVFAIKGRGLHPDFIKDVPALKVVWWLDNITRYSDFNKYINVYDRYWVIEEGQGHPWMAIGIDPTLHKPVTPDDKKFDSDIIFAGTAHRERSGRLMEILRGLPCNIALWGNSWRNDTPYLRGGAIYWYDLMKAYTGSKIILNNHYVKGITPNMRCIEAPASGTAMLSDTGNGLEQCLKKDKEYISYDSLKEARYLTLKYLEETEEREKIAKAGYRRIYKEHLLVDKLTEMIS